MIIPFESGLCIIRTSRYLYEALKLALERLFNLNKATY